MNFWLFELLELKKNPVAPSSKRGLVEASGKAGRFCSRGYAPSMFWCCCAVKHSVDAEEHLMVVREQQEADRRQDFGVSQISTGESPKALLGNCGDSLLSSWFEWTKILK